MINVENYIVNAISEALPEVLVISDYVDVPSEFPCVTVVEESNVSSNTFDSGSTLENHANVMYSVNVYSNLESGSKSQAKELMDRVDEVFEGFKFTRTFCQPIPNIDRTIYRYTARYTATIGKGVTTDDTTTYQIYR